ncbi:hypothetical protein [Saccharothrix xinjiangensis]|uniref:Uncharacterized protein n=1 Tax=Saccharothrix xinjiangensis TaxID=204798 RepID=A0ABV9Y5K8_9PSEU
MDWQETLRRLDADLAAGRITYAEHVKRRDQLLAEAASRRPAGDPDSTIKIRVEERPVSFFTPQQDRAPSLDGVSVFADARKPRRTGAWVVALVAVLAVVAGGVWWFAGGRAAESEASSAPPTSTSAAAPAAIPPLPGKPGEHGPALDVDEAVRLKLLAADEADVLDGNGVDEILFSGSISGNTSFAVLVARTDSVERADRVADGLVGYLVGAGYTETPEQHLTRTSPQNTVLRAVYRSGEAVVRVGAARAGAEAPTAELAQVLADVRAAFPER